MEDDELGTAGDRDARRVVEHADRHPVLLVALDLAEKACERRVHGQRDSGLAGEPAEPLRPRVLHPEAALEVDLAGAIAALQQQRDSRLGALPGGNASRPDPNLTHAGDDSRCRPKVSVW